MSYLAAFELAGFDHLAIERRKTILYGFTEALALANLQWLIENPGTPRLYQIAPKYDLKVRPLRFDKWADLIKVYQTKSGDCKDFVAIRLAEERKNGTIQCFPYITHKAIRDPKTGEVYESYHVQLAKGGEVEDPAANLGMPKNVTIDQIRQMFLR